MKIGIVGHEVAGQPSEPERGSGMSYEEADSK